MGKMSMENVTSGVIKAPLREVIYGPEGIGKTEFGASAPDPIFLGAEMGTKRFAHVKRFPQPDDLRDCFEAVEVLRREKHDRQTFVVDTLDWMEPLVVDHVLRSANKKNLRDVGGGFGEGHQRIRRVWSDFLFRLDCLQRERKMHIILLAHAQLKVFKNPQGDDFERWTMKLDAKSGALIREWAECVLFADYDTEARKDKNKRVRGVSSGARWLYTTRTAAFDAKNRYELKERMPLDFDEFFARYKASTPDDAKAIIAEIEGSLDMIPEETRTLVRASIAGAKGEIRQLQKIRNRVATIVEAALREEERKAEEAQAAAGDDVEGEAFSDADPYAGTGGGESVGDVGDRGPSL